MHSGLTYFQNGYTCKYKRVYAAIFVYYWLLEAPFSLAPFSSVSSASAVLLLFWVKRSCDCSEIQENDEKWNNISFNVLWKMQFEFTPYSKHEKQKVHQASQRSYNVMYIMCEMLQYICTWGLILICVVYVVCMYS